MSTYLSDFNFQKRVLWLNGLIPFLLLVFDLLNKNLGANPAEAFIRTSGVVSIVFLLLTLGVTPMAKFFNQHWLIRHRRWLGLWCFYYSVIHLASYSFFDKAFKFNEIIEDIGKRPFILLGFLGFLFLIPLAVTSSNTMIKKIGTKRWKKLHTLTYWIAPVVVSHYFLIVKSDFFYPQLFALLFSIVLLYRLVIKFKN